MIHSEIQKRFDDVERSRKNFLDATSALTVEQANFKPDQGSWSIAEIVEHIVRAEHGGVAGIHSAIEGIEIGRPAWEGERVHHGLPIETIIERTWQEKEKVPEGAGPVWSGPLRFWHSLLRQNEGLLKDVCEALDGLDPEEVVYPHPISGPLNALQRLEFLRFHMDRHLKQIEALKAHPHYPARIVAATS